MMPLHWRQDVIVQLVQNTQITVAPPGSLGTEQHFFKLPFMVWTYIFFLTHLIWHGLWRTRALYTGERLCHQLPRNPLTVHNASVASVLLVGGWNFAAPQYHSIAQSCGWTTGGALQTLARLHTSHCSPTKHDSVAVSRLIISHTFVAAPCTRLACRCFVTTRRSPLYSRDFPLLYQLLCVFSLYIDFSVI